MSRASGNSKNSLSRGDATLAPGIDVSRETFDRLELYRQLLIRWQAKINLVSTATLASVWTRHIADCAQVLGYGDGAKVWTDLGSGAGLPGIVLAIQLHDTPETIVHLIESDKKKCAFLREAIRATQAPATVHCGRIEDILPTLRVEALTSRALAPVSKLIETARGKLEEGALGVFLSGRKAEGELTQRAALNKFDIVWHPNKLDGNGFIAVIKSRGDRSTR